MRLSSKNQGYKLIELVFTMAIISVTGLVIYSLLATGTILGAKNTAINMAHQQARTAMLQMVQDLHSSISLPQLVDVNGSLIAGQGPAAGIAFQMWSSGPHKVTTDVTTSQNTININSWQTITPVPVVGQRLIIPGHQIEDDITAVTMIDTQNYTITVAHNFPVAISGTASYNIPCYISDRCKYVIVPTVSGMDLEWTGPTTKKAFSVMGSDITSPTPFTTPTTPAGALYYRFVAAIDLSTADTNYNNRGFKSANILLNGQVPMRARLTTYQ
jgi:type II secretory pathway pseudopilin PulG